MSLVKIYLLCYIGVFCHELIHYLIAKSYQYTVESVKIGSNYLMIHGKVWSISPIIGDSFITFSFNDDKKANQNIILFYMLPNLFYLPLIYLAYVFFNEQYNIAMLFLTLKLMMNLLPISTTDMNMMLKQMKENRV